MGWQKSGSNWWYKYSNGSYPKSQWAQIGGKWYHFNSSGYMQTGWLQDGGKWYYLGSDGAMVTGLQKVGSDTYYLATSGAMQTGWVTISKKRYYFDSSGKMVKNDLRQIDGKWYRFGKDGALSLDLAETAGLKPLSLKVTRSGYAYTGAWKVPSQAKGSGSDRRWKSVAAIWELVCGNETIRRTASQSAETTQATANINSFAAMEPAATYTRSSFYPVTDRKLDKVRLTVVGKGQYVKDAQQTATFNVKLPRKPSISWDYDSGNGTVTVTISADYDTGLRYDTMYMVEVTNGDGLPTVLQAWKSTTSTTTTRTFDTSTYTTGLAAGQRATFTAKAYSRGLAGDNPSSDKPVTASRSIAIPNATTIQSVTPTTKRPTGIITVTLAVGNDTSHIKLQRRHGEAGTWEDVDGAEDNGTAKTLYDSVGMAEPVDGEYLYYRIVATRDNFTTVGEPFRAVEMYTPEGTAPSTTVGIVSLDMSDDGSGAKVVVGWTETEIGSSTEVTWSTDPQAWESNQPPTSFDVKWKDATSQSQDWENTTTLYVRGLSAGETYYFKARRVYDDGTYSSYAASSNVTPENETGSVSLTAPSTVVRGQPFIVYWTYDGDLPQTEWHVHPADNPSIALASGRDSMGSATIQPDRYDGDTVSLYVSVGVGGELTDSNVVNVRVLEVPMLTVTTPMMCEEQPYTFTVITDTPTCTVGYKVTSTGVVTEMPDGTDTELFGDVIRTDYVAPEWVYDSEYHDMGGYVAEIAIPNSRLIDGSSYALDVFATDSVSGLSSETVRLGFSVLWSHQAASPDGCVTLTPYEDERAVLVALTAPQGASEGDVYDLYRGTAEGFALIREGLPLECDVLDRYASFGEQMAYRVCLRTPDGDFSWVEEQYDLPVDRMRLDWDGGFGELSHSLHFADSYAKDFEARAHMDGSIGGAYNAAITRSGTYAATSIKGREAANMEALGRHAGVSYCRTPDGHGFACNADVSRDTDNASMLESWSLSLTEVTLTKDFMPSDDDVEVPDELG